MFDREACKTTQLYLASGLSQKTIMEPTTCTTDYVALDDDKAASLGDAAKLLRDLDQTHSRASSLKLTAITLALAAALALLGYRAATPAAPAHTAFVASTTVDWPALRADLAHFVPYS